MGSGNALSRDSFSRPGRHPSRVRLQTAIFRPQPRGVDAANNESSTFDTSPSHFPIAVGPLYEITLGDARCNERDGIGSDYKTVLLKSDFCGCSGTISVKCW